MPLIEVDQLEVFYGDFQALFGVSLYLNEGEVVSIIGANGAGKSTLMGGLIGINRKIRGGIRFAGEDISGVRANVISKLGMSLVPEGRRLFPSLSVEDNLKIGMASGRNGPWTLEAIFNLFPPLETFRNHPATRLSGGQQQMVAVGRALLSNPRLLLCDELSLGLAPAVINDIYAAFDEIRKSGISILLVEQDIAKAMSASDRLYCFVEGRISMQGRSSDFTIGQISDSYFGT